jgi:hypothetical protein
MGILPVPPTAHMSPIAVEGEQLRHEYRLGEQTAVFSSRSGKAAPGEMTQLQAAPRFQVELPAKGAKAVS